MIIFPAFLIARTLKFLEIKFLRRAFVFIILMVFNFGISSGYIYVLVPDYEVAVDPVFENAVDEFIDFEVNDVIKSDDGVTILLSHSYPTSFTFQQNTNSWIDASNFFAEPTNGLFYATGSFDNKSRDDAYFQVKSYMNNELSLNIADSVELAVFDSLYFQKEYFRIELPLTDEYGLFKYGIIELNAASNSSNNIDFSN